MISDIDKVFRHIGGFGIYQWITTLLAYISNFAAVWSYLMLTFARQTPPVVCVTNSSDIISTPGNFEAVYVNDGRLCEMMNNSTCTKVEFGTNMKTIVSEWNLVCSRDWIPPAVYTVLLIGSCIGGVVFGLLADTFGRKPVLFLCTVLLIGLHVASAYSPSVVVYAILQFFIGACANGYRITHLNSIVENSPAKWHAVLVGFPSWAIAACVFAIAAWTIHDWRSLHLLTAGIGASILPSFCLFQESIRWLEASRQYEKSIKALDFIAEVNCSKASLAMVKDENETRPTKYTVSELSYRSALSEYVTKKDNAMIVVCLVFVWFSVSFGFHGLTLGINSLSGNHYRNMFLLNVVDVPAAFIATLLLYRFGRNRLNFVFLLAGGLACIVVGFLQSCPEHVPVHQNVVTVFGLIAKTLVGLCVVLKTIYSLELVSTSARASVYGILLLAYDIGACLIPFVIKLDASTRGILYFLTGSLLVSSSGIMLLLRDTNNIDDMEIIVESDEEIVEPITKENTNGYITLND